MADEDRAKRRTRSQAAPEWTAVEELVLVNEIAAVEADCQRELSSFQKWKTIAENCAAQDVSRTLSQYRRKWDSLLRDYRTLADFESRSRKTSFWSLDSHRRERLGLPMAFDPELFAAIRSLLRVRENQPESEPEGDVGANDDVLEAAPALGADLVVSAHARIYKHAKGSRKKRQRLSSHGKISWTSIAEDNLSESSAEAKPLKSCIEEIPQPPKSPQEKSPITDSTEENPTRDPAEEEPQQGSTENQPQADNAEEEAAVDEEARERMIAKLLRENAKRINSIVAESAGHEDAVNMERSEDDQKKSAKFIRRQGIELIACLGVICKTLDQLCNLAQEC